MHSYICGVCLVVEIVLRQIRISMAHNHQVNIDTYIMKNREKIISIYIMVMKDDGEMMFKKQILHENILYFHSYASYKSIPIYTYKTQYTVSLYLYNITLSNRPYGIYGVVYINVLRVILTHKQLLVSRKHFSAIFQKIVSVLSCQIASELVENL